MKNKLFNKLIVSNPHSMINQIPKFLAPLFSYVLVERLLLIRLKDNGSEILFKIGKSLGKTITQKIISMHKNKPGPLVVRQFLNEIENLGFGHCEIRHLNIEGKACIICNLSNALAKQYKKTFGIQSNPSDFFLSGLYSGCLSQVLKADCYFIEKKCVAKNDQACIFQSSLISPFKSGLFSQKELDDALKWDKLYTAYESEYPNAYIQKIIRLNQIKVRSGELLFWNIYCAFFPIPIYLIIYKICKDRGINISNELCYLTAIQARTAVLFQVNKFGLKSGIKTFNSLLHQLEMFGVGKGKVLSFSDEKLIVRFKNSYSLQHYKTMFQNPEMVDDIHLNGGSIIGMAQYALSKKVTSIKHKVVGNDMYYEIGFKENTSLMDNYRKKIKNRQIIEMIEEKMKHHYYLN